MPLTIPRKVQISKQGIAKSNMAWLNIRLVTIASCIAITPVGAADTWVSNDDGTVIDLATALVWQQQNDNVGRNYAEAVIYCQGLRLAGNAAWRLPNVKELTSLVDFRSTPSIDSKDFPATTAVDHWSSSTLATDPSNAWRVSFRDGRVRNEPKTFIGRVRCVR